MMRDLDLPTWLLATTLGGKKCFKSTPPSQGVLGSSCGSPTRPSGLKDASSSTGSCPVQPSSLRIHSWLRLSVMEALALSSPPFGLYWTLSDSRLALSPGFARKQPCIISPYTQIHGSMVTLCKQPSALCPATSCFCFVRHESGTNP